jgi:hypothetical protein
MTLTLPAPTVRTVRVVDLRPGDRLIGEDGGATVVYDIGGESLLAGFWTVRCEHGTLLLDMGETVTIEG